MYVLSTFQRYPCTLLLAAGAADAAVDFARYVFCIPALDPQQLENLPVIQCSVFGACFALKGQFSVAMGHLMFSGNCRSHQDRILRVIAMYTTMFR